MARRMLLTLSRPIRIALVAVVVVLLMLGYWQLSGSGWLDRVRDGEALQAWLQ